MLDANLKTQLKAYMENIRRPVELVAALDDSKGSRDLEELLQEISDLSDKVGWTRKDDARAPPGPLLDDRRASRRLRAARCPGPRPPRPKD